MLFLWLVIFATLIADVLSIARAMSFRQWRLDSPIEEAMEFASYPAKPHPIYGKSFLLWLSAATTLTAAIFAKIIENFLPATITVIIGILLISAYYLIGITTRTTITLMPDGLYFEATKRPKRPFLISLGDIVKVVATPKGFCLELKNIASVGKRFKMKCKKADELIGRLEKIL